ncbi:zinc finger BED domain-containing protein RICESLEEPER 3-like [Prosopis cineraria]|uniref:zinc finger BED domain-containing protein RICESLEEPER 3-like n=1 Tax=Prosopis cineraria TaxID=364024 RepID=UPI00240EFC74|nr:zinc finger BED domain-containing protein RICESLEEPER 3-like [Prosopis cineraria]
MWNSTYLMLENAVKFIKVFYRIEEEDEDYNEYFKKKVEEEPPSPYDWGVAKEFIVFLKLFYSMTLKFFASNFVTSNTCFQQIVAMQTKLKTSATNSNALLGDMVRRMQSKLDKYWGKADSMNSLLVIAVILDPRYKFKYVQVALENMYSELIQRELVTKNIMDVLYSLYGEYSKDVFDSEASQSQARAEHGDDNVKENQDSIPDDDVLAVIDDETMRQFYTIASIERQEEKNSEVDEYLHAKLVASRDPKFDVLAWWKVNAFKYKVLSLIVRDVLASPVSSESAFSTGGRVLDTFRSSLSAKMVEALICAQSWLSQPTFKLKELDVDNFDESDNLVIEEESGAQRSTVSSDSKDDDDDDDDDDPMQD